jgi:hypothetical protein
MARVASPPGRARRAERPAGRRAGRRQPALRLRVAAVTRPTVPDAPTRPPDRRHARARQSLRGRHTAMRRGPRAPTVPVCRAGRPSPGQNGSGGTATGVCGAVACPPSQRYVPPGVSATAPVTVTRVPGRRCTGRCPSRLPTPRRLRSAPGHRRAGRDDAERVRAGRWLAGGTRSPDGCDRPH